MIYQEGPCKRAVTNIRLSIFNHGLAEDTNTAQMGAFSDPQHGSA